MNSFFFFNDTATTEIYTLSLHDALPIYKQKAPETAVFDKILVAVGRKPSGRQVGADRSEEHTSELQSRQYLVCRLLLEKKKKIPYQVPSLQSLVLRGRRLSKSNRNSTLL